MFKNLYKKLIGTYETVTIEKVEVLGERVESEIHLHPLRALFLIEMRGVKDRYSRPKLKIVDVEAKKGDGSTTLRTYEIPSYRAYGIIDKLKNHEGREIRVRMRSKLPRKLPYRL